MAVLSRRRRALLLAGTAVLALLVSGCGSGDSDTGADADSPECAPFKAYVNKGKTVKVYATIRDIEADRLQSSWSQFEKCTGIKIDYEGSGDFEAQIQVRVQGGSPPDIAVFPQPGLLARYAKAGNLKVAPQAVTDEAKKNFSAGWQKYGTVDGKFYAAPLGSNVKSFVWYSPSFFKEKGYTVPTTWDQMIALSDKMAADGVKPWCVGLESGEATGWPATDWMEDVILREQGADVYDQWVNHQIPFNDPKIVAAADRVGSIIKNAKYVNGGIGDVKSITTTAFQEGGLPIVQKKCGMHRQASFYANQWPKGSKVAQDGDVYAFYFPPIDPSKGKPVLVAGEFVAAFSDKPEVVAVQTYLASAAWANSRAPLNDWVSANNNVDVSLFKNPIDKLSVEILKDQTAVARFDGSDLMPAAVGSGTFWKGMVDWVNGKDTKSTLDFIENSWPK